MEILRITATIVGFPATSETKATLGLVNDICPLSGSCPVGSLLRGGGGSGAEPLCTSNETQFISGGLLVEGLGCTRALDALDNAHIAPGRLLAGGTFQSLTSLWRTRCREATAGTLSSHTDRPCENPKPPAKVSAQVQSQVHSPWRQNWWKKKCSSRQTFVIFFFYIDLAVI